jgi:hypothetical protein
MSTNLSTFLTKQQEEILSYNFQYEEDVSAAIECPPVIHCHIPEGFEVRKARHGVGLFTTKFIPKDAHLFTASYIPIHDKYSKIEVITDRGNIVEMDTLIHFLNANNGTCLLDPVAGFINHSCSNNVCNLDEVIGWKVTRRCLFYALRDIHPNEGITINYALAAYNVPGN